MADTTRPLVAVIMGSKSDWEVMRTASDTLEDFAVPHENRVLSAHRTPELTAEFASQAEANGLEDRKSTRLNSSHSQISYAVFCLKKKNKETNTRTYRQSYHHAHSHT